MPKNRIPADLSGANLLYPYLQKELLEDDIWLFQMLAARLVTALGVWLSPSIYARVPFLVPHAIRDETARSRVAGAEQWASPTPEGYLRDDNSLIKEVVKSLRFESRRPHYRGRRIGRAPGWVAAHVWQLRTDGIRASRHHLTNSFVPNVVWLPGDLARLSDRPGSFVQKYLQALSHKLYAPVSQPEPLQSIVAGAWSVLEVPDIPEQGLPDASDLNFFAIDELWIAGLRRRAVQVLDGLDAVAVGGAPPAGLRPRRYRDGLAGLSPRTTKPLRNWLTRYIAGLEAASP